MEFSFEDGIDDGFGHVYPKKTETTNEEVHSNTSPNVIFTEIFSLWNTISEIFIEIKNNLFMLLDGLATYWVTELYHV